MLGTERDFVDERTASAEDMDERRIDLLDVRRAERDSREEISLLMLLRMVVRAVR